ncbi:hypothetical protein N658DRAFT_330856 [Parathielavia hyrcaniae]|uniref:Uncharacterized protein n=1 Tax=Parathielavia hyrcaniae TaxID=113614 RepID=A0AAN6Q8P7_9PEZI|nr:hypothetical protein N658DRAFT_330856 [Parathielavia hyrcaniae]
MLRKVNTPAQPMFRERRTSASKHFFMLRFYLFSFFFFLSCFLFSLSYSLPFKLPRYCGRLELDPAEVGVRTTRAAWEASEVHVAAPAWRPPIYGVKPGPACSLIKSHSGW